MELDFTSRLKFVLIAMSSCFLLGTFGYTFIEGWPLFDSFYMTVITLSTIGYGEIHTLSTAGHVFTIGLCLCGLGVMAYSFSALTAFIVSGELNERLRKRRMENRIKALNDHYVICGWGHTGETVSAELDKTGNDVVIIEHDEQKVANAIARGHRAVMGDALIDENLERAGVPRAKGVFLTFDNDRDNVFVALSCRVMNPKTKIISELHDSAVRDKLFRSGADSVVSPPKIGGLRMASEMLRPAAVGFLDSMIRSQNSAYRFEQVDLPEGSPFVGKEFGDIRRSGDRTPLLLAIKGTGVDDMTVNPPSNRVLRAGEQLVALGDQDEIRLLREAVKA
ncbi:MAG: potassium transporter TrkA [Elusimicrobia bacterium]|nr:MAG: potassium transporter TrkA [Elusimicrobiota bacterium]